MILTFTPPLLYIKNHHSTIRDKNNFKYFGFSLLQRRTKYFLSPKHSSKFLQGLRYFDFKLVLKLIQVVFQVCIQLLNPRIILLLLSLGRWYYKILSCFQLLQLQCYCSYLIVQLKNIFSHLLKRIESYGEIVLQNANFINQLNFAT